MPPLLLGLGAYALGALVYNRFIGPIGVRKADGTIQKMYPSAQMTIAWPVYTVKRISQRGYKTDE